MNASTISQSRFIIWMMMGSSLLLAISKTGDVPMIAKILFAITLWVTVLLFPYRNVRYNDYGKIPNRILFLIVLLTIIAVLRSILWNVEGHVGNKWLTLFGNEQCMFTLLAPCFIYLSMTPNATHVLKKTTQAYLLLGAFALMLGQYTGGGLLWFSAALFPYMKKPFKALFLLSVIMSVWGAFFAEETSRSNMITLFIVVLAYFLVYLLNNKRIIWITCLGLIFVPLVYAVMMLINPGYSIIEVLLDMILQRTGDEYLATDTRTFLFWEMAEDLNKNNAWLLGKGALSHYYSNYFAASRSAEADAASRIGCEVTFLHLLLRSGIIYAVAYYSLIVSAVVSALKKSQNRFLIFVAIMASGWCFFSSISYLNGCNYLHLGFFLLLGCCLSKHWLEFSDADIKKVLEK